MKKWNEAKQSQLWLLIQVGIRQDTEYQRLYYRDSRAKLLQKDYPDSKERKFAKLERVGGFFTCSFFLVCHEMK